MTLLLGRGGALDNNELEERRLERSLHVDEEIVGIAEKYVTVTELLGRRVEEEEGESLVPSSLQATLGVEVEEEEEEEMEEKEDKDFEKTDNRKVCTCSRDSRRFLSSGEKVSGS